MRFLPRHFQLTLVLISVVVVCLDQIFKYSLPTINNEQIALGINVGWATGFHILGFVAVSLYALINRDLRIVAIAITALSNVYDRIVYGYVRDYLHFLGISFNLSDMYLVLLVGYIIFTLWQRKQQ